MQCRRLSSLPLVTAFLIAACGPSTPVNDPVQAAPTLQTDVVVPGSDATTAAEANGTAANTAPSTSASARTQAPNPFDSESCIGRLRDSAATSADATNAGGSADYQSGLAAERSGDMVQARKSYFKLIQQYPASVLVPAAYFAFGEMFFIEAGQDPSKYALAQQAYNEAMKYPPPLNTLHPAAAYRLRAVLTRTGGSNRSLKNPAQIDRLLQDACP